LESASNRIKGNPSSGPSRDIKTDIEDKKDMVKKSMMTLEEAKQQYETLQTKMKRLDNLEETLRKEIDGFKSKITVAKNEVNEKFDRIDFMKEFFKNDQKKMQENLKFLEKNKNNYEKLVIIIFNKAHRSAFKKQSKNYSNGRTRDLQEVKRYGKENAGK
jgi:ATP-dependent helicase YprA (DUF1998 family)